MTNTVSSRRISSARAALIASRTVLCSTGVPAGQSGSVSAAAGMRISVGMLWLLILELFRLSGGVFFHTDAAFEQRIRPNSGKRGDVVTMLSHRSGQPVPTRPE